MDQKWLMFICLGIVNLVLVTSGLYLIYMIRIAYVDFIALIDSLYSRVPHRHLPPLKPVHA